MQKIVVINADPSMVEELKQNGADEVICALQGATFGAGEKYTGEEIVSAHADGVLLNRFYFAGDMQLLEEQLAYLKSADVRLVYFADPAVLYMAEKFGMQNKLVYQPETLVVSANDAEWWMERGLASVCVSPLLTIEALEKIGSSKEGLETAVFGRQVLSMSRRPLLRAYEKNVNGYSLYRKEGLTLREEQREDFMPVYEDALGTVIYNDQVQCSFSYIERLQKAGFSRFQINALFLRTDELLDAVKFVRRICDGEDGTLLEEQYREKHSEITLSDGYYREKTIK